MALNVVLISQRQSPRGLALTWSPMEGVASYEVFVATRKLSPEELEAAQLLGGTDECQVAKVGSEVHSVVDDVTPQGEARFYGVAMMFNDGAAKAARFKAVPDGATAESFQLSAIKGRAAPKAAAPRPAAAPKAAAASAPAGGNTGSYRVAPAAGSAPAGGNTGSYRVAPPAAAQPPAAAPRTAPAAAAPAAPAAAEEDPLEARKRAQREARARAAEEAAASEAAAPARAAPPPTTQAAAPARAAPAPSAPAAAAPARAEPAPAVTPISFPSVAEGEDPLEARKRAQREARERATAGAASERPSDAAAPAAAEPPSPPSSVPLAEPLEVRMQGATQTWDGLRIYWDREPRAAAYEIVASDHQLFGDELAEALAGNADFTTAVAVAPAVTCVIDNVTAREARGWYAVLVRFRDGRRAAHPFLVGDAATSGKTAAPFLNPNRTGELRGEVEDLLGQAQEQWERWSAEQDGGARREARRLISDALLIWPNHPAAKKLSEQMS